MRAEYEATGYKGEALELAIHTYGVQSRDRVRGLYDQFGENLDNTFPFAIDTAKKSGVAAGWVPLPERRGKYFVAVALYGGGHELDWAEAQEFEVE